MLLIGNMQIICLVNLQW